MSLHITFCATVAETKVLVVSPFGWYIESTISSSALHVVTFLPLSVRLVIRQRQRSLGSIPFSLPIDFDMMLNLSYVGIYDALEFPLALDQMLNLEMTFKVKWQSHWKNCSVVMLLKNDPFIKELKGP
ncbi:hypothetical protein RYX36_002356 [Vicia faba]